MKYYTKFTIYIFKPIVLIRKNVIIEQQVFSFYTIDYTYIKTYKPRHNIVMMDGCYRSTMNKSRQKSNTFTDINIKENKFILWLVNISIQVSKFICIYLLYLYMYSTQVGPDFLFSCPSHLVSHRHFFIHYSKNIIPGFYQHLSLLIPLISFAISLLFLVYFDTSIPSQSFLFYFSNHILYFQTAYKIIIQFVIFITILSSLLTAQNKK